ncbi:MAG: 4Fe-4S dicluster domain-containing protein [Vicinamibacterales bacterium]
MNPGKVIDPAPLDAHLRLDAHGDREPPPIATHFAFPEDGGRFRTATRRCVGVGKCRRTSGGVMCPSFVATREEMHSTRGRARLLFEMLEGDPLDGGWRDAHVREALDLCLACKGCRHDCPVGVDMATYKAEFLSHHYAGRIRPLPAYAFGYVGPWARVASVAPRLANLVTHAPGLGAIARAVAGIAPQRSIPAFAPHTFTHWFRRRHRPAGRTGRAVLLWPDTFNNHFHPDTAIAAVRVLERAGFDVHLPRRPLCCGRPLYDFGLLGTARRWLERILATIGPDLRRGVPVVGLEPSCLSVFRDELTNLLPDREDARALARQSYTLAEFLRAQAPADALPAVTGPVLLHGHCHDKSVLGFDCQVDLLRDAGASVEMPESGCCGMAGAFGFERDHYDVSMAIGERALLPAVRRAAADRIVMADGFSCREQIAQATGRRAKHLAEVLDDAASRSGAAGAGPLAGEVRRGAATGAGASPRETAGAGASADEAAGKGAASHAHIP